MAPYVQSSSHLVSWYECPKNFAFERVQVIPSGMKAESSVLPVLLVLYVVGYQEYIIFSVIRRKALWQLGKQMKNVREIASEKVDEVGPITLTVIRTKTTIPIGIPYQKALYPQSCYSYSYSMGMTRTTP